jgi:hypothetical protein
MVTAMPLIEDDRGYRIDALSPSDPVSYQGWTLIAYKDDREVARQIVETHFPLAYGPQARDLDLLVQVAEGMLADLP